MRVEDEQRTLISAGTLTTTQKRPCELTTIHKSYQKMVIFNWCRCMRFAVLFTLVLWQVDQVRDSSFAGDSLWYFSRTVAPASPFFAGFDWAFLWIRL